MYIDLHQDRSDNALYLSHKDFFASNQLRQGWSMDSDVVLNQVDYSRLRTWNINMVFGACCLLPEEMALSAETARYELSRHIKYYNYIQKESSDTIHFVKSKADLARCENSIWCLLHLEWYYFRDINQGSTSNFTYIDHLYDQWVRSIAPTRNTSNILCWWASDPDKWLTDIWKEFVDYLIKKWFVIDLAHIGYTSFWDIVNTFEYPFIVSHTQLQHFCNDKRNIDDKQVEAIAKQWGVIWLMPHSKFLGSDQLSAYLSSLRYIVDLVWAQHVAIWSDFDGFARDAVISGFDNISQFPDLYSHLEQSSFPTESIKGILGENVKNVLQNILH